MYLERLLALITAAVVAICLGVGLIFMGLGAGKKAPETAALPAVPAAPVAPRAGSAAPDKPAARARIEAAIAAAPDYRRFFARLRGAFPADYEAALDEFADRLLVVKQEPTVDYYVSEAVRRLRQSRGALASKAAPEPLARVFDMQLAVLRAVASGDKKLCVAFLFGASDMDFQRFAAGRRGLVAEMAVAGVDAIASGQDKHVDRSPPSEADFRAVETALAAKGLGKAEIDALLDGKTPDPPLDDGKMCAAGQTYLEVLRALPEPARMRIYGLAVELMSRT
jgi:hypothetical protein